MKSNTYSIRAIYINSYLVTNYIVFCWVKPKDSNHYYQLNSEILALISEA